GPRPGRRVPARGPRPGRRRRGRGRRERALAGTVRRPGREGGAARGPRRPAGRPPDRQRGRPTPGRARAQGPGPGPRARLDGVLVDAPCTGLGGRRCRPESRWRRSPRDLAELGPLQRELLHAALDVARPGGLVAYATCSPHAAETLAVVQDVLAGRADAELVDALAPVRAAALPGSLDGDRDPSRPWAGESGPATVQLWPHVHG